MLLSQMRFAIANTQPRARWAICTALWDAAPNDIHLFGVPDYHIQLTGHPAGIHFFLSFSDANRSALSMEADAS